MGGPVLMRRLHCPFDGPGLQAADGAPVSDGPEASFDLMDRRRGSYTLSDCSIEFVESTEW